ncbi:hypothetical protein [Bacteriophage Eos]|nr:hypothetical protein [Bacteriophage Eos]
MPPRPYRSAPAPRNKADKILQVSKELQDMLFQKGISVEDIQTALDIVKQLQKEVN